MYGPGQNRADDNSNLASAEQDCAGGNIPGSGALPPACTDGSFGNLFSVSGTYTNGPLYIVAAYEQHNGVNRVSDTIGFPTTPPEDTQGDPNDVANENAWKIAAQYTFPTKTTIGGIYEKFKRNVPAYLEYQNERQRSGTWLVLTQALTEKDVVSAGWAHAGDTPGDVGTHNTPGGANPNNQANMYTVAWKHAHRSQCDLLRCLGDDRESHGCPLRSRRRRALQHDGLPRREPGSRFRPDGEWRSRGCYRRRPSLLRRRKGAGRLGRRPISVLTFDSAVRCAAASSRALDPRAGVLGA